MPSFTELADAISWAMDLIARTRLSKGRSNAKSEPRKAAATESKKRKARKLTMRRYRAKLRKEKADLKKWNPMPGIRARQRDEDKRKFERQIRADRRKGIA
jgi:hypothetical protein